jgi:hypothetical protein
VPGQHAVSGPRTHNMSCLGNVANAGVLLCAVLSGGGHAWGFRTNIVVMFCDVEAAKVCAAVLCCSPGHYLSACCAILCYVWIQDNCIATFCQAMLCYGFVPCFAMLSCHVFRCAGHPAAQREHGGCTHRFCLAMLYHVVLCFGPGPLCSFLFFGRRKALQDKVMQRQTLTSQA